MKKTTKKNPSKASQRKAVKDLDVKPAKGRTVGGGALGPTGSTVHGGWDTKTSKTGV
jgi:hypothetical protein